MTRCQGKTQKGGRCRNPAAPGCKNCPYHKGQRGGSSCGSVHKKKRHTYGGSRRRRRRLYYGGNVEKWSKNAATYLQVVDDLELPKKLRGSYKNLKKLLKQNGGGLFDRWTKGTDALKGEAQGLREEAGKMKKLARERERARRKEIRQRIGKDMGELGAQMRRGVEEGTAAAFKGMKEGAEFVGEKAQRIGQNLNRIGKDIQKRAAAGRDYAVTKIEHEKIKKYMRDLDKLRQMLDINVNKEIARINGKVRDLCKKKGNQQFKGCQNYLTDLRQSGYF